MNTKLFHHFNLKVLLSLALLAAILFIYPILTYVSFVCITSLLVKRHFNNRIIPALFSSGVISIAIFTTQAILVEIISPKFNEFLFASACFAVCTGILLIYTKLEFDFTVQMSPVDIYAVLAGVGTIIFLMLPTKSLGDASSFIRFLSSGEDNASHFALYNRAMQTGSLASLDENDTTGLVQSLEIYPQGIHHYYAYISMGALHNKLPGILLQLRLYYLMNCLFLAGLVFVSILYLKEFLDGSWGVLGAIIVSFGLVIGAGLFLIGWGFTNQIAACLFLVASLYAIDTFRRSNSQFFIVSYTATVICLAQSWYLMLPIAIIPAILQYKHILRCLIKSYRLLIWVMLGIFSSLFPILLSTYLSTKHSPLNEPGGVYEYGWVGIITLLSPVFIFSTSFLVKTRRLKMLTEVYIAWLTSLVLALLVMMYQFFTVHQLSYYFYKMLYAPLVLSLLILVVATIYFLQFLSGHIGIKDWQTSLVSISMVLVLLIILKPVYPRVYVHNWFNHLLLPTSAHTAVETYIEAPQKKQDVLYVDSCSPIQDYLLNRWTGAIFLNESSVRSKFEGRFVTQISKSKQLDYEKEFYSYIKHNSVPTRFISGDCPSGIQARVSSL